MYVNSLTKFLSIFETEKSSLQVESCAYLVIVRETKYRRSTKGATEHQFGNQKLLGVLEKKKASRLL